MTSSSSCSAAMQNKSFDDVWDFITGIANQFLWGRDEFDFSRASRPQQIVASILTVQGLLDNGGFAYLFESDLPGDPGYCLSMSAFKEIGAHTSYEAYMAACAMLDQSADGDSARRCDEWSRIRKAKQAEISRLERVIWDNSEKTFRLLAEYIVCIGEQNFYPQTRD